MEDDDNQRTGISAGAAVASAAFCNFVVGSGQVGSPTSSLVLKKSPGSRNGLSSHHVPNRFVHLALAPHSLTTKL